jgi:hypothetical protein
VDSDCTHHDRGSLQKRTKQASNTVDGQIGVGITASMDSHLVVELFPDEDELPLEDTEQHLWRLVEVQEVFPESHLLRLLLRLHFYTKTTITTEMIHFRSSNNQLTCYIDTDSWSRTLSCFCTLSG